MGTAVLAHGGMGGLMELFPFLFLGGAVFVVMTALRDGAEKRASNTTRTLPTSPFSRQMHAALRPSRPERPTASPPERFSRRHGSPLRVMEGEAGENNRARVPQRFEPAPPTRRRKA